MHTQSTTEIQNSLTEDRTLLDKEEEEPTEVTNPTLDEKTKTDEKIPNTDEEIPNTDEEKPPWNTMYPDLMDNYPELMKKRIKHLDEKQ